MELRKAFCVPVFMHGLKPPTSLGLVVNFAGARHFCATAVDVELVCALIRSSGARVREQRQIAEIAVRNTARYRGCTDARPPWRRAPANSAARERNRRGVFGHVVVGFATLREAGV